MAQWFKNLKYLFLRFLGVRAYSISLNLQETEGQIKRAALVIHAFCKDEAIVAMQEVLRAQQTRTLFLLSSFNGTLEALHRLQGQLQAIEGLLAFIREAGDMKPSEIRDLRKQRQDEKAATVLNIGTAKQRQDTVI